MRIDGTERAKALSPGVFGDRGSFRMLARHLMR